MYACLCETVCDVTIVTSHLNAFSPKQNKKKRSILQTWNVLSHIMKTKQNSKSLAPFCRSRLLRHFSKVKKQKSLTGTRPVACTLGILKYTETRICILSSAEADGTDDADNASHALESVVF